MIKVFKVFLIENGKLKNLFKGINGTRTIKFNTWLEAEKKMSVDGSGQDPYLTGIHVLKDKKKAIEYLNNFRTDKNRVIVKCKAKGLRQKPTNDNVYLADNLYVPRQNFEEVMENGNKNS